MSENKGELVELDEEKPKKVEEELVVVETPPKADAPADKVAKTNEEEHDDEDEKPDADPAREAIRLKRRQEKIDRKKRRDEAMNRDQIELGFLRKRNDDLERRLTTVESHAQQSTIQNVDTQLAKAVSDARLAEQVIAKAITANNGDDVTQALRYRDEALNKANQLRAIKDRMAQELERGPHQPQEEQLDPKVVVHAKKFISKNEWYDPQGRDQDSAVVLAIDGALAREGFRPETEDYWAELEARAARLLPKRFAAASNDEGSNRQARGGPPVGSGREHAPSTTRNEVYISPERKKALQEAGVWDDPKLRAKFVKQYQAYDKEQKDRRA